MEGRHLLITGRVQGVGFRYSMIHAAQQVGATGWVRNLADGRVEAQVFGTPQVIAAVIKWARQGPPGARVDLVSVELIEGEAETFELRESA